MIAGFITAASALSVFFVTKDRDRELTASGSLAHDADQKIPLKKLLLIILRISDFHVTHLAFQWLNLCGSSGLWLATYLIDVKWVFLNSNGKYAGDVVHWLFRRSPHSWFPCG